MKSEELKIQAEFIKWVQNTHPLYRMRVFAVDNNSQSVQRGALSKALGVKKGVSDLIFILDHGRVIFVEVKTEIGKQTTEQRQFELMCKSTGHIYIINRSFEELKNSFNAYFFNIF